MTAPARPLSPLAAIGSDPNSPTTTIETDRDDYLPGDTVFFTGRGWAPGETVSLVLNEDPQLHPVHSWTVTAADTGVFATTYLVEEMDYGVTFTLTVTGQTSARSATVVFTDGRVITLAELFNPTTSAYVQSPSQITIAGGASFTVRVTGTTDLSSGGPASAVDDWESTSWRITGPAPSGGEVATGCADGINITTVTVGAEHVFVALAPLAPGTYSIQFRAWRQNGCSSNSSLAVTYANGLIVPAPPANSAPILGDIGPQSVNEGSTLSFTATATDNDTPAQVLTFSLVGAPAGATINPNTGAFTWTPTDGPAQTTSFTVKVTDNGSPAQSDEELITVTVNNVAPTATFNIPAAAVNEGSTYQISLTGAFDPSSDDTNAGYTYQFDCGAGYAVPSASSSATCTAGDGPGSANVRGKIIDKDGGSTEYPISPATATVSFVNVAPTITGLTAPVTVNEGSPINFSVAGVTDPSAADVAAGFTYAFGCDAGPFTAFGANGGTCPTTDNGLITIRAKAKDKDGGVSVEFSATVSVLNVAPTITSLVPSTIAPVKVGDPFALTINFTDPGSADTHTATIGWGDGTQTINAFTSGSSPSHTYASSNIYTVTVTITDDDNGADTESYEFVVVYDPNGGFVTGGGWIVSPAGAFLANPGLTGKATFGFVSKYLKGANVPTGNTEFQFHAGSLNFKSTSYEYLVVAGAKAIYKGVGTINGGGSYGFMLTAVDGQAPGGGGSDRFRIKIWEVGTENLVYDNQVAGDVSETAVPNTAIGGGSIVLHTK